MTQIKKLLINTTNPSIEARDLKLIEAKTGNLYESIAITAKRANQINTKIKDELHRKLEEFGSLNDNLEEISENKEQIEISRFYERMANPAIQATHELLNDKIFFRRRDE
ncbi:MAG TPA: DNA-directed RNA polymerase subunit omega [Chitinophagaceae bacterium]|jgi:DNA-directed RNA polymerase subunit K/omega|nr:DNA-directed RNA polymerase subunit omega [Chitinophagaceae bacterium]